MIARPPAGPARMRTLGVLAVFAAALLAAPLAGCALAGLRGHSAQPMPGVLEPIHAAAFTKDLAVFWVSSNGCTARDDLEPIVSRRGGEVVITLRRLTDDRCDRPLREGVELKWSFEELGVAPGSAVSVNNPYLLPSV